jgi:glycosyltransferase involved in cell wall biosynthesis
VAGPIDLTAGLEAALSLSAFDVVHLHEPLAPSPALAALRHARGVTAATFHRTAPLAGVAFVRPLVDRALAHVDLRIASSDAARRVLEEVLPGEYALMRPGVDPERFHPGPPPAGPPGIVVLARERERVGMRFALRAVAGLDPGLIGPVTVLGPAEAPWRTRAAIPKALRGRVLDVPDQGPASRAEALRRGSIALVGTPYEAGGPAMTEAMAAGLAVLAPRSPEADEMIDHGVDGLALPPFAGPAWAEAVAALAADPERMLALGRRAAERAGARTWDDVAAELEARYLEAAAHHTRTAAPAPRPVLADLRVRTGPALAPEEVVAACAERGIGVVAVAAPGGLEPALAVLRAAPPDLAVVVGQEIATREGVVAGLFLTHAVPDGLALEDALRRVRDQGGVTVLPHPATPGAPAAEALRAVAELIDCREGLAPGGPAAAAEDAARTAQRMGLLITAGSGADHPDQVGVAAMLIRPFAGPGDFLAALAGATPVRRRARLRTRAARERRRPARSRPG